MQVFFININDDQDGFYFVSFEAKWQLFDGECVAAYGTIETYRGRPQIIIESYDDLLRTPELFECPDTMGRTTMNPIELTQVAVEEAQTYGCIPWQEATSIAFSSGDICVEGTVYSTYFDGQTIVILFSADAHAFHARSDVYYWDNLKGTCIQVTGRITRDSKAGSPYVQIQDPDQLQGCN